MSKTSPLGFWKRERRLQNDVMEVVVTFLAVLEMVKEQQIDLYLENETGDPTDFYLDLKPIDEMLGENNPPVTS